MEELSYVLTQYFVSCVHVRFYFSLPLFFTLLAASISHCLITALNFHVVFLQNSSLSFLITISSSFSQITAKKTRLCCCFSFLKVRAAMRILSNKTLSCIWVAYLLIELFYIGMPVVRTAFLTWNVCYVSPVWSTGRSCLLQSFHFRRLQKR